MLQFVDGLRKFFPLLGSRGLSPHSGKVHPDIKVPRLSDPPLPFGFNVTLETVRVNQPGEDFAPIMDYVFDRDKYDVIYVNWGTWYNKGKAKPSTVKVNTIRHGNLSGFTPLTDKEYREDMQRFGRELKELRSAREKEGRWPSVIWAESTPQHFANGSFTWSILQDDEDEDAESEKTKIQCHPYASLAEFLSKGNWRNDVAQAIISPLSIPTLHWSRALHHLDTCHPFRLNKKRGTWGNDCTHFCEPSAKTMLAMQVFAGCLKETVETGGL
jgi:hypothetical protein